MYLVVNLMESSVTFSLLYLLFLNFPVVGTFSSYEKTYILTLLISQGSVIPVPATVASLGTRAGRTWGFRAGVEAELDGSGGGEGGLAEPQSPSVTGNVADFVLSSFHPAGLRRSR